MDLVDVLVPSVHRVRKGSLTFTMNDLDQGRISLRVSRLEGRIREGLGQCASLSCLEGRCVHEEAMGA